MRASLKTALASWAPSINISSKNYLYAIQLKGTQGAKA